MARERTLSMFLSQAMLNAGFKVYPDKETLDELNTIAERLTRNRELYYHPENFKELGRFLVKNKFVKPENVKEAIGKVMENLFKGIFMT